MKEQFSHFKALALKNLALQGKRKANTCCQVFIPIALAIVIGVLQVYYHKVSYSEWNNAYTEWQVKAEADFDEIYFSPPTNPNSDLVGTLERDGVRSGFIGNIQQYHYYTDDKYPLLSLLAIIYLIANIYYSPFFKSGGTPDEIDEYFYDIEEYCIQLDEENGDCYDMHNATSAILFNNIAVTNSSLELDYAVQAGDYDVLIGWENDYDDSADFPFRGTYYANLMSTALLRSALGPNNSITGISAGFTNMPYRPMNNPNLIGNLLCLFLLPFALSFLFSVYMHTIVQEKKEGLVQKMSACGLPMRTYWVVNYIYNFLLYLLIATTLFIFGLGFGVQVFHVRTLPLIILLFFWGTAQVSMCHFLTCFINSPNVALMVGFLLSIFGTIGSGVLEVFLFLPHPHQLPAIGYLLYPGIPFYHGFGLMMLSLINPNFPVVSIKFGSIFSYMLLILAAETVVFYLLTWYMEAIFPREFGIRRHPLYPIFSLIEKIKGKKEDIEREPLLRYATIQNDTSIQINGDDDVVNEANYTQNAHDAMVRILQLKKVYKGTNGNPDKLALNEVSFHIKKHECFGLLGPNGAGKTTLLTCLSGTISTSGTAFIDNLDIRKDIQKVHKLLGICPQFDVLWGELTVKEHLLFYFRLKNSSGLNVTQHVKDIIEQVGLEEVENRPASGLSGGQKRRLSLAIAMMGKPKLILLDEPTTGLDPSNRRALWDIISKAKESHSIILIIKMEEAEVLCSRIGIMRKAQLHSIGTPMHLKDKFGLGYNIKLSHFLNCEEKSHSFIMQLIPNAILVQAFGDLRAYKAMRGDFVLSDLFKKMEVNKHRYGIKEWSISQANLEEVFLAIVTEDEAEAM